MSEYRESRNFGLDLDWNAIYESNFEPTNFFSNIVQNLVPVLISAEAGVIFGPFYQVSSVGRNFTYIQGKNAFTITPPSNFLHINCNSPTSRK